VVEVSIEEEKTGLLGVPKIKTKKKGKRPEIEEIPPWKNGRVC